MSKAKGRKVSRPEQIHAADRGHGHVGGVVNQGKMNHMHGTKRKGRAVTTKSHQLHAGGPHPVMAKRGKRGS